VVSKVLLDTVLLLVLTVSPVPAHVVVARLVVPDLTMVSSEVSVSDTNFSQDTYQWVLAYSHSFTIVLSFSFFPMVDFGV